MSAVTLDADVVIGLLDADDAHHAAAVRLFAECDADSLLMSAATLSEVLVGPLRKGNVEVAEHLLARLDVRIVDVDPIIARRAAVLRAEHTGLKLPDALGLATALERDAKLQTFDERLKRIAAELDG